MDRPLVSSAAVLFAVGTALAADPGSAPRGDDLFTPEAFGDSWSDT